MQETSLTRFAWLSVGAALTTIILKGSASWLTGSVGLLSDAVESLVNLVAALIAVWALTLASRPPDADHAYGHTKSCQALQGTCLFSSVDSRQSAVNYDCRETVAS
jgi:divalent metal cation (Fe/Co/Zn/Cd) transporter